MTSAADLFDRSVRALLLLLVVIAPRPVMASPLTLDGLLQKFQALTGLEAHFRDEKHLALLAAPLVTEGTLYFAPPDRLLRETTAPSPSRLLISGKTLSFSMSGTQESMSLEQSRVAQLFVDGFLRIFQGDGSALHRMYEMTFQAGPHDAWTLRLKPKMDPLDKVFARIDLAGEGAVIHRMEVVESDGDSTVTTYSAVNVNRHFTPAERQRLFAPAP